MFPGNGDADRTSGWGFIRKRKEPWRDGNATMTGRAEKAFEKKADSHCYLTIEGRKRAGVVGFSEKKRERRREKDELRKLIP